jgi:hypothetical protein
VNVASVPQGWWQARAPRRRRRRMTEVAFSRFGGQSVRRWLAVAALGAFVGLLASTTPHGVHHLAEAAHHAPVACQLYALGVGIQWMALAALPALARWLVSPLLLPRHAWRSDPWAPPPLRSRAPPLSLP